MATATRTRVARRPSTPSASTSGSGGSGATSVGARYADIRCRSSYGEERAELPRKAHRPSARSGGRSTATDPVARGDDPMWPPQQDRAPGVAGALAVELHQGVAVRAHLVTAGTLGLLAACSAAPGEAARDSRQAIAAGTTFNFGAMAHPGSCMDARLAGTTDGTQIQEW